MRAFKLIDAAEIELNYQGHEEILAEIAERLMEQLSEDYSELCHYFECKDLKNLAILSHRLKGACSNFFAQAVVNKLYQIEILSKNGDPSPIGPILRELSELLEFFKEDLVLIGHMKAA